MIYLINYANKKYRKCQKLNTKTAYKKGKVDRVINYSDDDIDPKFRKEHNNILSVHKGNGYWLWKPYFIYKTLCDIDFGDYLMYCDSGAYFINDVHLLIDCMERDNQDLMCFEIDTIEKDWSKRDAFILMDADEKKYYSTKQREGGFVLIKKTKNTMKFSREYLDYSCDYRIISDDSNVMGKENYDGFVENRHDQTVYSILSKKYGYIPYRDIAQFGNKKVYSNSPYPQIVYLHRLSFCSTVFGVKVSDFLIKHFISKFYKPTKK